MTDFSSVLSQAVAAIAGCKLKQGHGYRGRSPVAQAAAEPTKPGIEVTYLF